MCAWYRNLIVYLPNSLLQEMLGNMRIFQTMLLYVQHLFTTDLLSCSTLRRYSTSVVFGIR